MKRKCYFTLRNHELRNRSTHIKIKVKITGAVPDVTLGSTR